MKSTYILFIVCIFLLILQLHEKRKAVAVALKVKKRKKERKSMEMLAKQFIGKECIVYTVTETDGRVQGTVKEVSNGGMIIEAKDGMQAVNLEFVTRIREYPRNSKGKKKSVVF